MNCQVAARNWSLWSMSGAIVVISGFSAWSIAWPTWQEHRALKSFAVAFASESRSGYLRARKNNPLPPGTSVYFRSVDAMPEFHRAVDDLRSIRGGGFAVPWLIDRLRSEDSVDRDLAEDVICKLGPDAHDAVPDLIRLLADCDSHRSVSALVSIGAAAIPALIGAMSRSDEFARSRAFEALGFMRGSAEQVVPALREAVSIPWTRSVALMTLARFGPAARSAEPEILEAIRDADAMFRVQGAECAWEVLQDADLAVGTLIDVLNGDDWRDQFIAIDALASIGPPAAPAVHTLNGLLIRTPYDDDLRYEAVRAIRNIGIADSDTVSNLSQLLASGSESVRFEAVETLKILAATNNDAVQALAKALTCEDESVVYRAIFFLEDLGPRARPALPALESLASKATAEVADLARTAMSRISGTGERE